MDERKEALKKRLDENYTAFIESLQEKTISELIDMAPEITAAQQLHKELLGGCDEEDTNFLLQLDDPLAVVRSYWESEITSYDHSGEMVNMLWRLRENDPHGVETQRVTPISKGEIFIDPVMDFSEKEIVAYMDVVFDVGKRFQVYPNMEDTCDLYVKYDPVSHALQGELSIKDYDGNEHWQSVAFLPSEQEMIIGAMEKICHKDSGKSLRDTWLEYHPAVNRKNLHKTKNRRRQNER